ncbi:MAG: phosphatidylserine/phosphatidylglycerophosphate/cardiolipin synthase family protein [Myxococcales bacterium]|nr:phosphatidylserine/phosphatidylglycerophosphate/cardiolipin synthase family protein [Myxococcales bacterium]
MKLSLGSRGWLLIASTLLVFLPSALPGCSAESEAAPGAVCGAPEHRKGCVPAYPPGKADAPDPCAANGWYDDANNFCDDPYGYCAHPDPDCGPDPDACGDTPESEGMLWKGDPKQGCLGPGAGAGDDIELLLTEPYCDVCTDQDKAVLKARSPLVKKIVELVDGAEKSVDVSQFTFSVSEIADALLRAHARGVKVRLAIDSAQKVPESKATALANQGLDVRFVSGKPSGPEGTGLLHAKFLLVDGKTLLNGSNNFSSTGTTLNEENAILVRGSPDHPLISGFSCHFSAIWDSDHAAAGACTNPSVAFTPSSAPIKLLEDRLNNAKKSVDVLMHHLTFTDLVKELRNAAQRGVRVRVLLNVPERAAHSGTAWNELVAAGGRIRYKRVNEAAYQLMHHKLVIIDGRQMIDGSGNWSGSAFFNNFENYVVVDHPRVMQRIRELYHRLWTWSLTAASLDQGRDAAQQHVDETHSYFGNLHAHFHASADGVTLDDGKPEKKGADGQTLPVSIPGDVGAAAENAFAYSRDAGGLDFQALSPHCHDDGAGNDGANMSEAGFAALKAAAAATTSASFVALAGMEWSTNSLGNHVGVVGSGAVAKTERGRFDTFYGEFLPEREAAGDRPLIMLNHPKTFRADEAGLEGNWDMIFGVKLTDIPKASERGYKFNDYGIDDFAPLKDVRAQWIAGEALPDPIIVDKTLAAVWASAAPFARTMEVTLGRGTELGGETPANPSLVDDLQNPGAIVRRTRLSDLDFFLTRGFRLAPTASHDNHYANWGTGHTSRTVVMADRLSADALLDAIEQREVYASEDQNLSVRFFAADRVPMGGSTQTPAASLSARLWLADPDYSGPFVVRLFHGTALGKVEVVVEESGLSAGWHPLTLDVPTPGEHFFYVEVLELDANRAAWTAPIWVDRI